MGITNKHRVMGERQRAALAELIAEGVGIIPAGRILGLGKTPTRKHWEKIKADLGLQAQ